MIYLQSIKEVSGIYVEAAQECYWDAKKWLGRVVCETLNRIDSHYADLINGPDDQL